MSVQKKATMCAYAGDSSSLFLCLSVRPFNLHSIFLAEMNLLIMRDACNFRTLKMDAYD